jgi:hypothetical protein
MVRPMTMVYPQKGPMILQRTSPPCSKTPFEVFDKGVFTPNDVRSRSTRSGIAQLGMDRPGPAEKDYLQGWRTSRAWTPPEVARDGRGAERYPRSDVGRTEC